MGEHEACGPPSVSCSSRSQLCSGRACIAPAMKQEIEKGTIPGAVTLIARNGKIVHFETHGFLDSAKTKPMTRDAVFRGFSMTKPFVAVAAVALMEQGKLSLRDPLAQYFPEFKDMK